MEKRNTILILGIFSIIILVAVQVVIVRGIWQQKDEMFNLRYRMFSQNAIAGMNRRWGTDGFDTARYVISAYSAKAVKELEGIKNDSALAAKKLEVLDFVIKALYKEQDLSQYLSDFFGRQGLETNFKYRIALNYFELIDNDIAIPVYVNENFIARRPPAGDQSGRTQGGFRQRPGADSASTRRQEGPPRAGNQPPSTIQAGRPYTSEILVRGYRSEDNFYRLDFDYYIDFSDKQKVILRETAASLGMSILSIIVVVILFLITYRNLMEERRLSNLKTDFINNMTHELKTPLSTITVAGRTLEMEQIRKDDSKILETAKLIGKQSVHLNQLINMILEISMWERTQFELDKKKVSIEEVMNDILNSFRAGCGNCATLTEKYNFNGAVVDLDLVYFTTLMNNLLSNAVKYSDKDPEIGVEGFAEDGKVSIKVADNGIGISKGDQKRIFDKFYRASTGNIHKYKGLGLGLYYVKKIAEAHGGDVSVSSKPGKGSIFTVTIPY